MLIMNVELTLVVVRLTVFLIHMDG